MFPALRISASHSFVLATLGLAVFPSHLQISLKWCVTRALLLLRRAISTLKCSCSGAVCSRNSHWLLDGGHQPC